jgi:hypothetical protein
MTATDSANAGSHQRGNQMNEKPTIIANNNPDLYIAEPIEQDGASYTELYFEPIIAWAIEQKFFAACDEWSASATPVTPEGSKDDAEVIYNRATGDWLIPDSAAGNGEASCLDALNKCYGMPSS